MQLRKSLLLEMILIVQLKSNSSWKKKDEDCSLFPLEVTLIYTHNHSIASANAVKFNDVSEETKRIFLELFQNDHSASSAYEEYKNYLLKKHGEQFVFFSADKGVMPDHKWVLNFHANFVRKYLGK